MKGLNEIITVMWMLFADYMGVLLLIGADLWSGVRKAKIRGEVRSSYMYKKTVDKIARYYNALLALTIVDVSYLYLGAIRTSDSRKFKGTFYESYLFDKTLSEDEINYYKSKMQ